MEFLKKLLELFAPTRGPQRPQKVIKNEFHKDYRVGPTPIGNDEIATLKLRMLVAEAERWINVRERGKNSGPEVEMFQRAVDGKAQGEAWCAAFVCFCVKQVDDIFEKIYGFDTLKSQIYMTEHCLTMWNKSPQKARVALDLHPGLICIWQHHRGGKQTTAGHMGIIKDPLDHMQFVSIEGNTEAKAAVDREGDGVYAMHRIFDKKGSMRVKGFLNPWDGSYIKSFL